MTHKERAEKLSIDFSAYSPTARHMMFEALEAYAREVENAALERAAELLDGEARFVTREFYGYNYQGARYECSEAIRALKSKEPQ